MCFSILTLRQQTYVIRANAWLFAVLVLNGQQIV